MEPPRPAPDEPRRLEALRRYDILDTPPEEAFDDLTALAAFICETPIALLTLVDEHRQWFKSRVGTNLTETSRAVSFCGHAILQRGLFVVPDAAADARFADNPLVVAEPYVRFYAGSPLVTTGGEALGALCVIDRRPRRLRPDQRRALAVLSRHAMRLLEWRRHRAELAGAEEALRKSEAGRRAVWESALDAIVTMDHEGRIVDLNPAAERAFGRPRETAVGRVLADLLIPPALRERHRLGLQRYLETGEARVLGRRVEMPALRADGTEFPAELTVVAVPGGPRPIFIGTLRDVTEARRAREAILRERNFSNEIINSLPGVFYLFDAEGRWLRWNRNFEAVTGYSGDEIAAMRGLDLFRGPDREHVAERVREVFAKGSAEAEASIVGRDGRATPYYFTGRRIDVDGRPCVIGMGVDVSALKRAEAERDRLFNLSPDLLCIASFDGYFRQVNPAWERVLGHTRAELLSRPYLDFVHPDDRERTLAEAARAAAGTTAAAFENRYRCRDGTYKWLAWSATAVPEEQLIFAMARDVTEQKAVSSALRESEARYRGLVESARDGIVTLAPDLTVTSVNRAFETITGWARTAWIGRPFASMLHAEDAPRAIEAFRSVLGGGSAPALELRVAAREGGYVPMELTATRQHAGEEAIGLLGIARDMRERRRMEEELRRVQKLESLGRLSAGIAHDFNNLLTVAQGHLSLLLMEPGLPAHIAEHVQEVAAAADRAAALTRQLLLFSRGQVMQRRRLDANQVVATLARMLDRLVGETIVLRLDCEPHLPLVDADPSMLEQVLMNLVVNARDAMPAGGRITIGTRVVELDAAAARRHPEARPGRFIRLSVADTGCGIPPEALEKIFEPFFTTKEAGQGTGLGLATVHGIVKQHDGWTEIESAPDAGTTFRIFLPAAEGAAEPAAIEEPPATVPLRGGSETILAVEDEQALRRLMKTALERYGYRVLLAADGVEALELWRAHGGSVDLLVTDMVMPHGISGWELAERLRAERPELKVLVVTGYDPHAVGADRAAAAAGRVAFLQKPYVPSTLVRAVRECLEGAG
ncbi:MAG TPA: PAS domain S-box protein [Vicinamibacterales bacterium]|nr:PAS domain S-box protein [Vicinamibacterales bacterium]